MTYNQFCFVTAKNFSHRFLLHNNIVGDDRLITIERRFDFIAMFNKSLLVLACASLALALSSNAFAAKKVALVIGNGGYSYAEHLPNPVNDAKFIASKLKKLGFKVIHGTDLTEAKMKIMLRKFANEINKKSVALFYYAGHGMQKDGKNYLIPVNADIKKSFEIEYASIDLNYVLSAINEPKPKLSIAFIDACRDNPFEKIINGVTRSSVYRGKGLAAIDNIHGSIISYATAPGSTAVDGYGEHSPYTSALLKYLDKPGLSVQEMLNEVGLSVMSETGKDQKPWYSSSPVARFCFAGCGKYIFNGSKEMESLALLKAAIENRDIATIKRLAIIKRNQEQFLKSLFSAYESFKIEANKTRSINKKGKSNEIIIKFTEATNHKGNRVIPSANWNRISVNMK